MNRHYDSAVLDHVLTNIRQLTRTDVDQLSIGADLIVGFPGETEEQFKDLLVAIDRYQITKLHTFPFSPHNK